MTHKRTGREVYDALLEHLQIYSGEYTGEYVAGFGTRIDGKVYFDALALRLNEIIVPEASTKLFWSNDSTTLRW